MAIQKTLKLVDNFGEEVTFANAYIKVTTIAGGKDAINVIVGSYKSANGKLLATSKSSFIPAIEGKNFIAQAYDHIKTLPEFAGSVDC